jgi:hypothetical protein
MEFGRRKRKWEGKNATVAALLYAICAYLHIHNVPALDFEQRLFGSLRATSSHKQKSFVLCA